jgi:Tol biopolymer transport system component
VDLGLQSGIAAGILLSRAKERQAEPNIVSITLPHFPTPGTDGLKQALLRYHTDAGVCVCLGDGSGPVTFPFAQFELSHDGSTLAALEWLMPEDPSGEEESDELNTLLVQDTGTGQVTQLETPNAQIVDLAWAPTADRIWFSTGGWSPRFTYSIDLRTEEVVMVAPGVSPTPSPDGKFVAFYGLEPHGVHILDTRKNQERFATSGHPHAWSPDSRYLACLDVVGSAWQMYVYDVHLRQRTHTATSSPFSYWPTWFPDSRTLAFEVSTQGKAGPPSVICRASIGAESYEQLTSGPWDEQPRIHPRLGYMAYYTRNPLAKSECHVWVVEPTSGQRHHIGPGQEASWLLVP